jgi:WS/DGAT/MGAT family acyltransferase
VVPNLDQVPVLRSLPGVDTLSHTARTLGRRGTAPGAARGLTAPRTRFNVSLTGPRSVAFGTLPLAAVRRVREEMGVTVNDVVMALCAGALRRRLAAWDELPEQPLLAYVPVSVRAPEGDHFGNAISSIIAAIPTHLGDARERVAFASESMRASKRRHETIPTTLLSDTAALIPAPLFSIATRGILAAIGSSHVTPPVNLIISNVMGSPIELRSDGCRILAQYPQSLIFDGIALNITVASYVDGLDIGITADSRAMPDAWELLDDMRAELETLAASCALRGRRQRSLASAAGSSRLRSSSHPLKGEPTSHPSGSTTPSTRSSGVRRSSTT